MMTNGILNIVSGGLTFSRESTRPMPEWAGYRRGIRRLSFSHVPQNSGCAVLV